MRILFCSHLSLTRSLGATKVVVELAEAMQELGWDCTLRDRADLFPSEAPQEAVRSQYPARLREHLRQHAADYDVVDYDHEYLPFPRGDFPGKTLLVARSVLLTQHLDRIAIPTRNGIRARLGAIAREKKRQGERRQMICRAQATVEAADLVNVSNEDDRAELIRRGIPAGKIVVIPFGISRSRRLLFDAIPSAPPGQPTVAFVGTFDYRKGAREFPAIAQGIVKAVPGARFRLLGTAGMFQTDGEVLAHFPRALRQRMEVVPKFRPEELPSLLAPCSVGIFPSYMEGMPFGVLEMLAASMPVVAYNAPGPPMMLPVEYLVPRGDFAAMSARVAALLRDPAALRAARLWAKQRSQQFRWEDAAQATADLYLKRCREKQRGQDGLEG